MQEYDAILGIYSKEGVLTEKLKSKFQDKYLDVLVFDNLKNIDLSKFSYLIINLLERDSSNFDDVRSIISGIECKIIILYPLYVKPERKYNSDSNIKNLLEINANLGVILVPEMLGSGVKYVFDNVSHGLIMQSLISERIKIDNSGQLVNLISLNKLVDKIVREFFSFGISGQILALVGHRIGKKNFLTNYLGVNENDIISHKSASSFVEVSHTISIKIDFSLKLAVNATKNTFLDKIKEENTELIKETSSPNNRRIKKVRFKNLFRNVIKVFVVLFLVFITPLIMILLSVLFLFLSTRFITSNMSLSEKFISYSSKTILISRASSWGIPIYYNYSNILYKISFLLTETLELSKVSSEFASKTTGNDPYDISLYSDSISAVLDRIHTDIGFLQIDINELDGFVGVIVKQKLALFKIDIGNYKSKIFELKNFSSRLGTLLGVDKPMKYLVLFQNNMELRPTGGFIGSFALISFDKGRMTEIVVNDVYSADGQLKGHVDPPEPIRIHLGEGGWFMRDANWDPNFPDSATKIEWFLDKEINQKVDGVIAIDLSFVKSLLKISGPLNLSDYGKTITADNLYVNIQEEVESNFFPGSIKKASFITALAKQLITEVETLPKDKYFALLKEIYVALEERHFQFFFHDTNAQESIINLGYAGNIDTNTECGLRCFNDTYSVIDANLGVNKSNIFIQRSHDINLYISKQIIKHELLITYTNTANIAVGNSGLYKSYTRLLLPINADVSGVRLYDSSGSYEDLKYDIENVKDRREIGFLINILPSSSKRVQIVWNIKNDSLIKGGEYRFLVRKQAGTDKDNLNLKIETTDLSLTGRAPSGYTTNLSRDFKIKLFFKPND